MSAGLFSYTSFVSETTYIPEEQRKVGQDYNALKSDREPLFLKLKRNFKNYINISKR